MDGQQLRALKPELDRFLDRYAPLFGRDENQAHARRFVQGLLHKGERRNIENIAEGLAGGPVRSLQAFVTTGAWHEQALLAELRRDVLAVLADEDAVWNSDETGFPKKGAKSVGVKRQYSGTLGRTDNCQIGVFANYCSSKGHTFMDRRLFLPEEWAHDAGRRAEAGVPEDVLFRTKPALALEMVAQAAAEGIPFRWVGGDSVYGDNPTFVQGVRALGKWYVLDIACDTLVWTEPPQVIPAAERPRPRRGRPPTTPLVIGERRRVDEIAAALPATAWQRVVVGEGSQGPRMYEYAELAVWLCEDELPGPAERLLVRRPVAQLAARKEWKYHRSNAAAVSLAKVAQVRGTRWTIEEDIQCGKGECGLDEYETRGWVGWHHHTALSLLALAFLVLQKQRLGEKRVADDRSRSAGAADASVGGARVGRRRNSAVVGVAARTEPSGRGKSSPAAARRTAAAAK
jgi:SRSO17 transposase